MKASINSLLLGFILLFATKSFCQDSTIKITFIGNCGLHLTDGNTSIYVDFPYKSGAFHYMEFPESEIDSIQENSIFLFTHKHADHFSGKNIRKTLRMKGGQKFGKWNISDLHQLNHSISDFSIEAIETEHSLSFKHYSYLIVWHGKRIYISGDIESIEDVLALQSLDWAFVPYWIMVSLAEAKQKIDAKMIGVYHFYPTSINTNLNPEKIKLLDHQGDVILIDY